MRAYQRVLAGLDLSQSNAELILERACLLADVDAIEVLHISERRFNVSITVLLLPSFSTESTGSRRSTIHSRRWVYTLVISM